MTVSGSSELWGVEFESSAILTDGWDATLNVAWSDNQYTEFTSTSYVGIIGTTNFKGRNVPRYPKWMANLSSTYTQPLTNTWDWYIRGDILYQGKTFADLGNLAQRDDYMLVHARLGILRENMRVELFVRNLFDEKGWAGAQRAVDFTVQGNFNFHNFHGINVVPPDKRTFGIRTNISF